MYVIFFVVNWVWSFLIVVFWFVVMLLMVCLSCGLLMWIFICFVIWSWRFLVIKCLIVCVWSVWFDGSCWLLVFVLCLMFCIRVLILFLSIIFWLIIMVMWLSMIFCVILLNESRVFNINVWIMNFIYIFLLLVDCI